MSRTFDHDLNVLFPGAFRKLSDPDKFFDLADIRCIGKASRTAGISERNRDIVLGAATVILAMGEGRRAAAGINEFLKK